MLVCTRYSAALDTNTCYRNVTTYVVVTSKIFVMLQNLMRKLLLEKCEERVPSGESVDDIEVILRRNKQTRGRQRKRITSCPDPAHLQEIHCENNLNILELRRICE